MPNFTVPVEMSIKRAPTNALRSALLKCESEETLSSDERTRMAAIYAETARRMPVVATKDDADYLYGADPNCAHRIVLGDGGSGIKCMFCRGWFCY